MNSAWIFGYMQWRVRFYGMIIDNTHPIYNALTSHPCVKIENNRLVTNNEFIKPEFYFLLHRTQQKQNIKSEYINYYIDINEHNIFESKLIYLSLVVFLIEKLLKPIMIFAILRCLEMLVNNILYYKWKKYLQHAASITLCLYLIMHPHIIVYIILLSQ